MEGGQETCHRRDAAVQVAGPGAQRQKRDPYAGSIGSAASTLYQSNYQNAAKYLSDGGVDPELEGLVDPEEYARMIAERSGAATERMIGWADKLSQEGAADIAKAQKGLNPAGRLLVNAGVGVTQMAGDAAIGVATGGGAMLPMLVRSFGGGAQEARAKGYSEGQQVALGLTSAATEFFSEKLFGGNPVYDSDVGLINRLVGKIVRNPTVMEVLASAPVETVNEGLEEIVSDILNPVAEWVITGNGPEYELDRIIEDGAVGVLTALMANGGAAVANRFGSVGARVEAAREQKTVSGEETGLRTESMLAEENMNRYRTEVDGAFTGALPLGSEIVMGRTPKLLQRYGAKALELHMTQSVARKIAYPTGYFGGKHNLGLSVLKNLPYQIADPIAILKIIRRKTNLD